MELKLSTFYILLANNSPYSYDFSPNSYIILGDDVSLIAMNGFDFAAIPLIPVGIPLIVDLTTDPHHDLVVDRNQL